MPSDQTGAPGGASRGGWRGGGRRHEPAEAVRTRHGWEQPPATERQLQRTEIWRRLRLAATFALAVAAFCLLMNALLFAPPQTPLIAVATSDYGFPIPPNAWAVEDVAALSDLHQQSLRVVDASNAWRGDSAEDALSDLRARLASLEAQLSRCQSVVLYLNMHGAVALNAEGKPVPYLIPASARSFDESTWIRFRRVLDVFDALPDETHKLLVLDSHRLACNWDMGLLYNRLAELLPEEVENCGISNLAVLTSAGPGEVSWTSGELRASVFGHYFRQALAGDADREGNDDRQVSLGELHGYLRSRVDAWVRTNRDARQQPALLLSAGTRDFDIAWVTDRPLPNRSLGSPPSERSTMDVDALWEKRDRLRDLQYGGVPASGARFNPLAWSEYEKKLLWLEQLLNAGPAYEAQAVETVAELEGRFARTPSVEQGYRGFLGTFVTTASAPPPKLQAHSLPLAEFLGLLSKPQRDVLETALQQFRDNSSEITLAQLLDQLTEDPAVPALVESQLLRLMERYRTATPWSARASLRSALDTRHRAERVAAPPDERAWPWIQPPLDRADHFRRLAEDRFFGEGSSESEADAWTEADSALGDAERIAAVVLRGLQQRDRVWAEAVYLAQWFMRPRHGASDRRASRQEDAEVAGRLATLIRAAHRLDAVLAGERTGEESLRQIATSSSDIREQTASLREQFDRQCQLLIETDTPDPDTYHQILEALALPLPTAQQRRDLRQVAARFQDVMPDSYESVDVSDDGGSRQYAARWPQHAAAAVLAVVDFDVDATGEDRVDTSLSLDVWGDRIRQHLRQIPGSVNTLSNEQAAGGSETRRSWSEAERQVRTASGFWYRRPTIDPIGRLRQLDLQQVLLWHAQRSLEDFWGLPAADATPFFEYAANSYLVSAGSVLMLGDAQRERFALLTSERNEAARHGVTTSVDVAPRATPDEDVALTVQVSIQPTVEDLSPAEREDLPPGYVTVLIRDMQLRIVAVSPPWKLSVGEHTVPLVLSPSRLAESGSLLQAVVAFRGHEFSNTFEVDDLQGRRIVFEPEDEPTAQITVLDRPAREKSVIFVLDCSGSMNASMMVDNVEFAQMDIAKDALQTMLNQFASQGDVRVGVLFYGHRVGWSTDEDQPVEILRQYGYEAYGDVISQGLMPSQDVESVLDLGKFDLASAGKVARHLRGVQAWGQSPLYLALVEALNQFSRDDPATEKSIVVITDGINNQFTHASSPVRPPRTGRVEIEAALQEQRVPIYFVGFGIPAGERAEAEQQFDELAQLSGGGRFAVDEAPDLVLTLRGLFGQGEFTIQDPSGREVGVAGAGAPGPAPLGKPLRVKPPSSGRGTYRLVVDDRIDETLELPRGRWLKLVLADDQRGIRPLAYDQDSVAEQTLVARDGSSTGLKLRVHPAMNQGGSVRFRVSLQDESVLVTPQPVEVWLEVTPWREEGGPAAPSYVFYDPNFLPREPVPVLDWTANDWPPAVDRARLRLWCKPRSTPVTETVSLGKILAEPTAYATSRAVDGISGMTYQLRVAEQPSGEDRLRVSVIEHFVDETLPVPATKVELQTEKDARPRRVVRRFDPERRIATHSFFFSQDAASRLQRSKDSQIAFTYYGAVHDDAWKIPDQRSIVVSIFSTEGLLNLNQPGE